MSKFKIKEREKVVLWLIIPIEKFVTPYSQNMLWNKLKAISMIRTKSYTYSLSANFMILPICLCFFHFEIRENFLSNRFFLLLLYYYPKHSFSNEIETCLSLSNVINLHVYRYSFEWLIIVCALFVLFSHSVLIELGQYVLQMV